MLAGLVGLDPLIHAGTVGLLDSRYAAAPESRLDWFQNPTVNKGLGAGLATIALAGVGAGIG